MKKGMVNIVLGERQDLGYSRRYSTSQRLGEKVWFLQGLRKINSKLDQAVPKITVMIRANYMYSIARNRLTRGVMIKYRF